MPYKEKNGKWRGHKMIEGKRRTKLFETKREALQWEARQSPKTWRKEETDTGSLMMVEWANDYLDHCKQRLCEKTYKDEKVSVFKRFFRFVSAEACCSSLRVTECMTYLSRQAHERGNKAANKDRKNLSAAWNWGGRYKGLSQINPFASVEPFPADSKPRYVPPEQDFWKVFEVAGEEDQVFLLVMLHTAARRGELFRLRWSDVDFGHGQLQLGTRKRKGGSLEFDWVPLTKKLHTLLHCRFEARRSEYVFSDQNGQPFTSRQHVMKRLCERAGVKHFGFHAIRHLSASILADDGVAIPKIQRILRHKNVLTTSRYIHGLVGTDSVLEDVFGKR